MKYKALEITEDIKAQIIYKDIPEISEGEVLIKVEYSSLNYKDCLSISGHRGVTRNYPHIPGIDAAGIIISSKDSKFIKGDKVIVTGYDLGMNIAGGFSQMVKVPGEWVVHLPEKINTKQAMQFGTAGFTAALSVDFLESFLGDLSGQKILVTGVKGGVGSIATLLLKELGAHIIVATSDPNSEYLKKIFYDEVIDSKELMIASDKPLLSKDFAGAIDNLGEAILANIIKRVQYHGVVCACGNVTGVNLHSNILPFILRGVTLKGVTSANETMLNRVKIWRKIAKFSNWSVLEDIIEQISLEDIEHKSRLMLKAEHQGRFIVKI